MATKCNLEGDEIVIRIPVAYLPDLIDRVCEIEGELADLPAFARDLVVQLNSNACSDFDIMVASSIESMVWNCEVQFVGATAD